MARIDDIKKKAKLSMDEMYSCTPESKDLSADKHSTVFAVKQQRIKKFTLYVTEELFKEFNDIYARRMLAGKKTDKSALICEAIELLVEKEGMKND